MNCYCGVPAIIRKVSKSGENFNKDAFMCVLSQCQMFEIVGPIPSRLGPTYIQNKVDKLDVALRPSNLPFLKVILNDFEEFPPRIWFSLVGSFNNNIDKIFQSIQNTQKVWKDNLRLWLFDFSIYEKLISSILALNQYKISELPRFLITGLNNYISSYEGYSKEDLCKEPNLSVDMLQTLLPFQLDGVRFVIKHKGKALIGDEMGCGKTLQAIACIQHYSKYRPVLILVPVNLLLQWKEELLKFLQLKEEDICLVRKGTDNITGDICLVTYTILDNLAERASITSGQFPMVIADESHNIKSKDSKRTINTLPLLKGAKVTICLTGTPALNRPVELYTQLNGLLPHVFNDYDQFILRYCDAKKDRFSSGLDAKGSSNESELKLLLQNMVMIRRLKAEVIKDLPKKSREIRYCKPDIIYEKQLKDLDKRNSYLESQLKDINVDENTKTQLNFEKRVILNSKYQITGMSKITAITKELKLLIDEANKSRNIIEKNIQNEKDKIIVIDDVVTSPTKPIILSIEDDIITEDNTVTSIDLSSNNKEIFESSKNISNDDEELLNTDSEDDMFFHNKKLNKLKKKSNKKKLNNLLENDVLDEVDASDEDYFKEDVDMNEIDSDISKRNQDDEECNEDCERAFENESRLKKTKKVWDKIFNGKSKSNKLNKETKKKQKRIDNSDAIVYKGLGQKILVFAHHLEVLDAIENFLNTENVGYIRVDSNVTAKQKNSLISKFQKDDQTDVALLSITSCGTGLNLTTANVALFAELYWSPGVVLQAEDRIHRLGQKSSKVRIIYLIAKNTADDIVWEQIQRKHNVLGATVGIADNRGNGMIISKLQCEDRQQSTIDTFFHSPTKNLVDNQNNSNNTKGSNLSNLSSNSRGNPYDHISKITTDNSKHNLNKYSNPYDHVKPTNKNIINSTPVFTNIPKTIPNNQNNTSNSNMFNAEKMTSNNQSNKMTMSSVIKSNTTNDRTITTIPVVKPFPLYTKNHSIDSSMTSNTIVNINESNNATIIHQNSVIDSKNNVQLKRPLSPNTLQRIENNKKLAIERKLLLEKQKRLEQSNIRNNTLIIDKQNQIMEKNDENNSSMQLQNNYIIPNFPEIVSNQSFKIPNKIIENTYNQFKSNTNDFHQSSKIHQQKEQLSLSNFNTLSNESQYLHNSSNNGHESSKIILTSANGKNIVINQSKLNEIEHIFSNNNHGFNNNENSIHHERNINKSDISDFSKYSCYKDNSDFNPNIAVSDKSNMKGKSRKSVD